VSHEGGPAGTKARETDAGAHRRPRRPRRILRLSTFPTLLTMGNLVVGVLAIAYLADAHALYVTGQSAGAADLVTRAGWMIMLGMVFDALDGRVARLTRTTTEFGGALDSLADVVTFGVAPAFVGKVLIEDTLGSAEMKLSFLAAAFYAACAALRLARYNAEHEEPDQAVSNFKGLPSPGAAGVLAGLAVAHQPVLEVLSLGEVGRAVTAHGIRFALLLGLGLLMVSRVPYLHVANRFLAGRKPVGRVALILLLIALLLMLPPEAVLAIAFLGYALSGPLMVLPRLVRGRRADVVPELFD